MHGSRAGSISVSLLGPTLARPGAGGALAPVTRCKAALALLALAAPRPVSSDRLIDEVWGDDAPAKPDNALDAQISYLRRLLGRDVVVRQGAGYVLEVDADEVDAHRFERLVGEGLSAAENGELALAAELLQSAVGLVRGPILQDLMDHPFAGGEVFDR